MILTAMPKAKLRRAQIPPELAGRRLDQALAALFPDVTRSQLQQWIASGHVRVGDRLLRKRDKVHAGESVEVQEPEPPAATDAPEPIALDIVYEDASLLVIDKPPGPVVH